jgi:hypothetical protein
MNLKKLLGYSTILAILTLLCCIGVYWQISPDCGETAPEDPNVEVVISACLRPHLYSISPDGTYLVYGVEKDERGALLRNLVTGEEQELLHVGYYWLSDRWLLQETDIQGVRQFWIFDVIDRTQTPLQWVNGMPGMVSRLNDGTLAFSSEVLAGFQKAETVYFVPESLKIAVAVAPDFKTYPENNYVLATPRSYQTTDPEAIVAFLTENAIPYVEIKNKYYYYPPDPLPSHNGRFIATGTLITTSDDEVVVRAKEFDGVIYGWAYDDSGIYYQLPTVRGGPILMPLFSIGKAEPILKLKVPEAYLQ